jgi:hypothetical protein
LFAGAVFSPVAYPLRQDMVPGFFGAASIRLGMDCVSSAEAIPRQQGAGRTDREKILKKRPSGAINGRRLQIEPLFNRIPASCCVFFADRGLAP